MERGEATLIELVNRWAAYSGSTPDADLAGFCLHYLTEQKQQTAPNVASIQHLLAIDAGQPNESAAETRMTELNLPDVPDRPEARLGGLLGRMAKFAYFYSKKAMQPFDFKGPEDPIYLFVVLQMGAPKKSEVIHEMIAEFASGIDVINRLIKQELLEEFPDTQDRRSKRLRLTTKGMAMVQACYPVMNQVVDVAYSSLTEGEKAVLLQILDKLDRYHAEHYKQSRTSEFSDVYKRMVG